MPVEEEINSLNEILEASIIYDQEMANKMNYEIAPDDSLCVDLEEIRTKHPIENGKQTARSLRRPSFSS